ncbi:MAG: hypothetical protein JNM22_17450 [Saprospiraceae bacterium]|nr:hypothetical protein [Saprospiraceae bacterium]
MSQRFLSYLPALAVLILGLVHFYSNDTKSILISGALLAPILIYSLYTIQVSDKISDQMKRYFWFVILPILSIIGRMVFACFTPSSLIHY